MITSTKGIILVQIQLSLLIEKKILGITHIYQGTQKDKLLLHTVPHARVCADRSDKLESHIGLKIPESKRVLDPGSIHGEPFLLLFLLRELGAFW